MSELVKVTTYSHPDWDMTLTLADDDCDHMGYISEVAPYSDLGLLEEKHSTMTREELEGLAEWDG
jgi:hypothetical protein